mgnify:CR=1 FL=1
MNERTDRRVGFLPVPDGIERLLTDRQVACLKESGSRLSIAFVRSEDYSEPIIVVRDNVEDLHGILSHEGVVYYEGDLRVRT